MHVSKDQMKTTAPKGMKIRGDWEAKYTLQVAFNHSKYDHYCKDLKKNVRPKTRPFYSKIQGQPEPAPEIVMNNFFKIMERFTNENNLRYANIYLNLNRGWRVNQHMQKNLDAYKAFNTNIEYAPVDNILLVSFDSQGSPRQGMTKLFFDLPYVTPENLNDENLKEYYKDLKLLTKFGVTQAQRDTIYAYLKFNYLIK